MLFKKTKKTVLVLVAMVLSAVLSACSNPLGLPEKGEVERFPAIEQRSNRVFTNPRGPKNDESPEDIVKGFFDAMPAGVQSDGFRVARDFLTSQAAHAWDGNSLYLVAFGEVTFVKRIRPLKGQSGDNEDYGVDADVRVKGQVDTRGQYSAAESGATRSLNYSLSKVEGQWRIDRAPNVVVILDSDFEQVFRQVTLYRADSWSRYLLPDVRWFAWRDWRTMAVKELLNGDVAWLGGAIRNPNTHSAKLKVNAVPMDNDRARITLNSAFDQLSEADRALLVRQMRMTLGDGDADYAMVVRTSSGQNYSDADSGLSIQEASATTPVYSLSAGNIVSLDSSAPLRLGEVKGSEMAKGFVFGPDGGAILLNDSSVTCLKSNGDSCGPLFKGARLRQITGGIKDEIWGLSQDGSRLLVQDASGAMQVFPLSWLGTVTSLAVSPDGGRLALAVQSGASSGVVMVGVIRNQSGAATRINNVVTRVSSRYGVSMLTFYNDITLVYGIPGNEGSATQGFRQVGPGPEQSQRLPSGEVKCMTSGRISDISRLAALDSRGVVRSDSGALDESWTIVDTQSTVISQR